MPRITIQDLAAVSCLSPVKPAARSFPGISIDSRTIRTGELFIAIRGPRFDGHDFIAQAIGNGASAVIAHPDWITGPGQQWNAPAWYAAPDGLAALQSLAQTVRRRMTATIVAITGTNGKTTTKDLCACVLEQAFRTHRTPGNLNNQYGLPLTILGAPENATLLVLEMGASRPGDIADLCKIAQPDIGIITNVGRAHLEFFGTLEAVIRTKAELLESLHGHGTGIVKEDQMELKPWYAVPRTLRTFGLTPNAGTFAGNLAYSTQGCGVFQLNGVEPVALQIPGEAGVLNALAAAAAGAELGIAPHLISRALAAFRGTPQRQEVFHWHSVTVINDSYNANPDSMRTAIRLLSTLRQQPAGHTFAILGDMLELGDAAAEEHRSVGRFCAEMHIDGVLTCGPLARLVSETAGQAGVAAQHYSDHAALARDLLERLQPGDCILVKGSRSMRMEQVLELLKSAGS